MMMHLAVGTGPLVRVSWYRARLCGNFFAFVPGRWGMFALPNCSRIERSARGQTTRLAVFSTWVWCRREFLLPVGGKNDSTDKSRSETLLRDSLIMQLPYGVIFDRWQIDAGRLD